MGTRAQNERKFGHWDELPGGGRRYVLVVRGRLGWTAPGLWQKLWGVAAHFWGVLINFQFRIMFN